MNPGRREAGVSTPAECQQINAGFSPGKVFIARFGGIYAFSRYVKARQSRLWPWSSCSKCWTVTPTCSMRSWWRSGSGRSARFIIEDMKFELNSHILIAHWIPGFFLVMAFRPMLIASTSEPIKSLMGSGTMGGEAITALALAVVAFLAGEFLDASRDLLEDLWDLFQTVEWNFFSDAKQEEIEILRSSLFSYYVFDHNVSLALIFFLLWNIPFRLPTNAWMLVFAVPLTIFIWNGIRLRSQIASRTKRWAESR